MRYVLNVGVLIINDDYDDHDDYAAFNIVQYRIKIIVRSQKKKQTASRKQGTKKKWTFFVRLYFGYDRVRFFFLLLFPSLSLYLSLSILRKNYRREMSNLDHDRSQK